MNPRPINRRRGRLPASILASSLLLIAACGGDDADDPSTEPVDTVADDSTDDSTDEDADDSTVDVDPPVATLPTDVPEEYLVAVGPMDVEGEFLPVLETDDFDADPAVGAPAPVVVGVDFDGNPVRIDPAQDGPTMVTFLAHWCPHCNDEIPVINELRDDGRFPDDLNIVAVSTAPDPSRPNFPPGEWLDDKDWTYPAIAEGIDMAISPPWLAAEAYGVSGFPFIVLVDADGNVVARWSGGREPDQFIEAIDERLGL